MSEQGVLGPAHANIDASRQQQVRNLTDVYNRTQPEIHDANRLLTRLAAADAAFTHEQRQELAATVSTRMRVTAVCTVSMPQGRSVSLNQRMLFMYNYLDDDDWGIQMDPTIAKADKHQNLVNRAMGVGCRNPDEVSIVGMVVLASNASKRDITPEQCYDDAQDLKSLFLNARARFPGEQTIKVFPRDVTEFTRVYPDRYSPDKPPVRPPIDSTRLDADRDRLPKRVSDRRLKSKQPPPQPEPAQNAIVPYIPNADPSQMQQLGLAQAFFSYMMGGMNGGHHSAQQPNPAITILKGGGKGNGPSTPDNRQPDHHHGSRSDHGSQSRESLVHQPGHDPLSLQYGHGSHSHLAHSSCIDPSNLTSIVGSAAPGSSGVPPPAESLALAVPPSLPAGPALGFDLQSLSDDVRGAVQRAKKAAELAKAKAKAKGKGKAKAKAVKKATRAKRGAIAVSKGITVAAHEEDAEDDDDDEAGDDADKSDGDNGEGDDEGHAGEADIDEDDDEEVAPPPMKAMKVMKAKPTLTKMAMKKLPDAPIVAKKPAMAAAPLPAAPMVAKKHAMAAAPPHMHAPVAPAAERPPLSKLPTKYNGGTIYYAAGKHAFRCYKRVGDKVEKHIAIKEKTNKAMKAAWKLCCDTIDADPRARE